MEIIPKIVLRDGFDSDILDTRVDETHTVRDVLGCTLNASKQDIIEIIARQVIDHIYIDLTL